MRDRDENVEIEHREKKTDSSKVASTFIKYAAYVVILLIVLWFLANYILPMF
ncbi:hypothetical protein [Oceanobacillus piezotolerans]|uniref:hypothetical protein n=1 Tax=Oceanobacillus piezotolerans TaxID=2448030 RepID=UPI0016576154|nr:hypothetical protein [Oceanobacillus piezotolerans]